MKKLVDAHVTIIDIQGKATQLKTLEPREAKRMLGVFLSADGNNDTHIKHMRVVTKWWYDKVLVGHRQHLQLW